MSENIPFDAVICLATYKRPAMLRATLNSLLEQKTKARFCVYVVENEAENQEGLKLAKNFIKEHNLNWKVLYEPNQGNVYAINKAFMTALNENPKTQSFLMIDDDEIADRMWLSNMLNVKADIVGGPVHAAYEVNSPFQSHPVFIPAFKQTGIVDQIWGSGNCLITRPVFEKLGYFDLAFNHLGGADSDFFTRARLSGFKFYWCEEAIITETVPASRLKISWILARGLRIGALNVLIEKKTSSIITVLIKSLGVLVISPFRALKLVLKAENYATVLHPVMIAFGRFLPFFNLLPKPYKG